MVSIGPMSKTDDAQEDNHLPSLDCICWAPRAAGMHKDIRANQLNGMIDRPWKPTILMSAAISTPNTIGRIVCESWIAINRPAQDMRHGNQCGVDWKPIRQDL